MLSPLLVSNPSSPRLSFYDESAGTRMDFSAQTLDNWASKVANMLDEEFDLGADAAVLIDIPVSWQAAVIALGTYNSARLPTFAKSASADPDVVFTTLEGAARFTHVPDVVVVSDDPFGRGVVESGGDLPLGAVDFGPTVRFYGDEYFGPSPQLSSWAREDLHAQRYFVSPWHNREDFEARILGPLAAGGSAVVVTGLASADRLEAIMEAENVTRRLL